MCEAGKYSPITGSVTCFDCPLGARHHGTGATMPACPKGSFSDDIGASACALCPRGGVCGVEGAASVRQTFEECRAGTFNPDEGATNTRRVSSVHLVHPTPSWAQQAPTLPSLSSWKHSTRAAPRSAQMRRRHVRAPRARRRASLASSEPTARRARAPRCLQRGHPRQRDQPHVAGRVRRLPSGLGVRNGRGGTSAVRRG